METKWTSEEAERLRHEEFMAEVLKIRRTPSEKGRKGATSLIFETSGGTALITVLIGGLLTGWVTSCFQRDLREKDYQQKFLEAQNSYQLEQQKTILAQQEKVTTETLELLGRVALVNRNLLDSYHPSISTATNLAEVERIRKEFQETTDEWRERQDSLGWTLAYAFGSEWDVSTWGAVLRAADSYIRCARDYRPPSGRSQLIAEDVKAACREPEEVDLRTGVQVAMSELRKSGGRWEGFKDYQELRKYFRLD